MSVRIDFKFSRLC
ncbi:hypothetical protein MTR67_018211 [Solanum verrucosum]|uniref:Uncharacterized protein n=1 Tax=Solanum verrucosum TaxID=315347 RepID=A0AAF0QK91_SOLVR|nr:hypothetical protein MTR67_018211 [Solanum verrucosum]